MQCVSCNLARWGLIALICAAPCFLLAHEMFEVNAMICGVVVVALAYAVYTSSDVYQQYRDDSLIRHQSITIAFGLKAVLSLIQVAIIVLELDWGFPLLLPDILLGIMAVSIATTLPIASVFWETFLATMIVGAEMSLVIWFFGHVIWLGRIWFHRLVILRGPSWQWYS